MYEQELNDASASINQAVATAKSMRSSRESLAAQLKGLQDEKHALLSLPLNKADIKAFIFQVIDQRAGEFLSNPSGLWADSLSKTLYPKRDSYHEKNLGLRQGAPICLYDVDQAAGHKGSLPAEVFGAEKLGFIRPHALATAEQPFMFFFGDVLKAKIEAHFDELFPQGYSDQVLTVAQRRTRLSEIETQIAGLLAKISEIDEVLARLATSAQPLRRVPGEAIQR